MVTDDEPVNEQQKYLDRIEKTIAALLAEKERILAEDEDERPAVPHDR